MNQYTKNINFAMRLHKELREDALGSAGFADGWSVILGQDSLKSFYVSEVDNPPPEVRSDAVTVAGMNGSIYTAEDTGRVLFEDKTVTVKFGGRGDDMNWNLVSVLRSNYQGRLVDFTFEDYRDVKRFQTGRVSVDFDPILCTFEMVFTEVPPFLYSTQIVQDDMAWSTNYELYNNPNAWQFDLFTTNATVYKENNLGSFAVSKRTVSKDYYKRVKPMGTAAGAKLLFGVVSIVGGDVWFVDNEGRKSKTYATTCDTTLEDTVSELRMEFTVDGSYYEWVTTEDQNKREYLPTVRCQYVLSNYVSTDEDGNIINSEGSGIVTYDFPSNVQIHPDFYALDNCWIVADGVAAKYPKMINSIIPIFGKVPKFELPRTSTNADGTFTKSVFCAVRDDNQTNNPYPFIRFIPVEVF